MRLAAMVVYPLKGARGVAVERWRVATTGFARDRQFMVVDAGGRFISQREQPAMALWRVSADGDAMRIELPGHLRPFELPWTPEGDALDVTIWSDRVRAVAPDPALDAAISRELGQPCRLVHIPDTSIRQVDPHYSQPGDRVGFADGFPFLLCTQASLDDLNARLDAPVPMNRFRPNLVIEGATPFAEDTWSRVQVGALSFDVVKPCARCVVTTVDQATARGGKEPLRTLATYRRAPDGSVHFGQNLIHRDLGVLSVGDPVAVITP
ncbi:MAG: MOSC domain-containing protein [Myxococcota bacterium]